MATPVADAAIFEDNGLLEWVNYQLGKVEISARNLCDDMEDGFFIALLVDIVTGDRIHSLHSRLFFDQPIDKESLIAENHDAIHQWFADKLKLATEDAAVIKKSKFKEFTQRILWYLITKSVGYEGKLKKHSHGRFQEAKILYEKVKAPFPFEGLGLEEKGSTVFIRTCILLDKMSTIRNELKEGRIKKWVPAPQRYETTKPLEVTIYDERVLRIFLSSTFRDMQNERDQFFQHGAVELKNHAKTLGLELVFIDLRWGLTSKDSAEGWVVIRCLDSIAKCPYFVCSLGARYGWIPNQSATELNLNERFEKLKETKPDAAMSEIGIEWRSETSKRFPFIEEIPGLSVTEYEIQYAAMISKPACSRVFFYFRDEDYAVAHAKSEEEKNLYQSDGEEGRRRQELLKGKVKEKYGHVVYKEPKEYSDLVTHHLVYAMNQDFSNNKAREPEDQAHHQYKNHRLVGFGGRKSLLEEIKEKTLTQLDSDGANIILLAAKSGMGKSSLMAASIRDFDSLKRENLCIFYHFVGCTNVSNYAESISIRFWKLVVDHNEKDDTGDAMDAVYEKKGLQGLFKAIAEENRDRRYIFMIDAVNQIRASQENPVPHLLTWLPKNTPKNVAMIVSTIDTHPSCKVAEEAGISVIKVEKLGKEEIQESSISFLRNYDKSLNEGQLKMILDDSTDTGHPLYLRLVLDEIRVFGVYEKLDSELNELVVTNGVIELYTLIIERWRAKFNKEGALFVDKSMKVLYISRIGLSESDLDKYMEYTIGEKFELAEWKSFFFTIIESLFVCHGRYMFFHQLLIETTKECFFSKIEVKNEVHKEYGEWLYSQYSDFIDLDEEMVAEICFQLAEGECYELLVEYLKLEHVVLTMLSNRYRYEFFRCWRIIQKKEIANYKRVYGYLVKSLSKAGDMLVEFFLELHENTFLISVLTQRLGKRVKEESKSSDYFNLGRVYKNLQRWNDSLQYFTKCLDINARATKEDKELLSSIHQEIGSLYRQENRLDKALEEYQKSLKLRLQKFTENTLVAAESYDCFGDVHLAQNNVELAKEWYQKAREIRQKKVGSEHPLMAHSWQKLGDVFLAEGKFEESLKNYRKAKEILEKSFGDKHPSIAHAYKLEAEVYKRSDRKEEALKILVKSKDILLETALGENHPRVVACYQDLSNLYYESTNYTEAFECFKSIMDIRKRTTGEHHPDFATSLENVGRTNFELKRFDQVVEFFRNAAAIRKETNTVMSLKDGPQIDRLIQFMKEKKEHEPLVQLYKVLIYLQIECFSIESVGIWSYCKEIDNIYKELKQHKEGFSFWREMKEMFSDKLGWIHSRTLNSCEYLSHHSKEIGTRKEPAEFTRVKEFITENTIEEVNLDEEWKREQIISCLFQIVFLSQNDESKSKDASDAITFLNFMNVSFGGMDLSNIKIPNANLSNSIIDGANFTGANLEGVDFTNSILGDCVLDNIHAFKSRFGVPCTHLNGHGGYVKSLCKVEGPNGENWLASGSVDTTVCIWNVATGKQVRKLEGHTSYVMSICSIRGPNGENWLASGSHDKTICIWDVDSGNRIRKLEGHIKEVRVVCAVRGMNEENWLVSGGADERLVVWDLASGNQIKKLEGHAGYVDCAFGIQGSDGEKWLASGSKDRTIFIWDLETGAEVTVLEEHKDTVKAVCAIKGPKNENWLASGSADKTIRIWDTATGRQIKTLEGHTSELNCICSFHGPNGEKWLVSGSSDNTIRIWNIDTGVHMLTINSLGTKVNKICVIQGPNDEVWLASASDDPIVRIWDLAIERQLHISRQCEPIYTKGDLFKTSAIPDANSATISVSQISSDCDVYSRCTKGGNIRVRDAQGLTRFQKMHLFSLGAVSFDKDFADYCERGVYTIFQAKSMADCFENGWGIEMNAEEAGTWKEKANQGLHKQDG